MITDNINPELEIEIKNKLLNKAFDNCEKLLNEINRINTQFEHLKGFTSFYRKNFEEENNPILTKIEKQLKRIESLRLHSGNSPYEKPSLAEIKEIAIESLYELGAVATTSRLLNIMVKKGYEIKHNSLRYVLSQAKNIFEYNPNQGGWQLRS